MPDLDFQINDATAPPRVASPQLAFELAVSNTPVGERVHSVMLQCQIWFEAAHRSYNTEEQEKLRDLFGAPEQWGRSLKSMLWTQAHVTVPSFAGHTVVDVPVECTYDLHVTGTKYLHALDEGEVPLRFLFSGTCFYEGQTGALQVQQIAHSKECTYRLPVERWKTMIDRHYPNAAWLTLRRNVFERLHAYKRRHGLPTWEDAVERLLPDEEQSSEAERPAEGVSAQTTGEVAS